MWMEVGILLTVAGYCREEAQSVSQTLHPTEETAGSQVPPWSES